MQIAEQIHSLAQGQNDSALMIGAYRVLAVTLYFLGDFEAARQYARRGVQIWRAGEYSIRSNDVGTPAVGCLCLEALSGVAFRRDRLLSGDHGGSDLASKGAEEYAGISSWHYGMPVARPL